MTNLVFWMRVGLCGLLLGIVLPIHAEQTDAASEWKRRISVQLASQTRFPPEASVKGLGGTAKITFTIDRSGKLISDQISESSGFPLLDTAAIEMLHRAQPFPAAPAELSDDSFTFTVPVNFVRPKPMSTVDAAKFDAIEKAEGAVHAKIHGVCRGC